MRNMIKDWKEAGNIIHTKMNAFHETFEHHVKLTHAAVDSISTGDRSQFAKSASHRIRRGSVIVGDALKTLAVIV